MSGNESQAGYASLTAIILCAALSLLCTGLITLAMSQARSAKRDFFREQQLEAMNTALLMTGAQIETTAGAATIKMSHTIGTPQGNMTVTVRAEQEARKWPLAKFDVVSADLLKHYTSLDDRSLQAPQNADCLRTLFSVYGQTAADHDWPQTMGLIASGGHDGEVWRLRAVNGNHMVEETVRFLGDPQHLFAVISREDHALGEMPTCQFLNKQP